jgi:flagellar motility protein MotE (MotC chaperone)
MTAVSPISSHRPRRARAVREQIRSGNFGRMPVLRLLPAVILAALCMLGFRVQVVVQSIADARTATVQVSPSLALAQDVSELPDPVPAEDGADDGMVIDENGDAVTEDMTLPNEGQVLPTSFDPTTLTQSEIETLQRLAERREIIEKRERELQVKEGLLRAAEGRIDGKIVQLQDLEQSIEGLLSQYDEKKQGEIEQLVRIYGAMKPKDAARIFDSLEMPILVSVMQSMKENKVAPILAAMSSAKATALTEELSTRRQLSAASQTN